MRNAYLRATGILPEQATSTSGDNEQFNGKRIEAIGEDCPMYVMFLGGKRNSNLLHIDATRK